jgi:hypothetical protein
MYSYRLQIHWVFHKKKKITGVPSHHLLNVLALVQFANKNGDKKITGVYVIILSARQTWTAEIMNSTYISVFCASLKFILSHVWGDYRLGLDC